MPTRVSQHPLFRAYKVLWWIVAIWLSASVLTGVIRGAFVTGPVPEAPAGPGTGTPPAPAPGTPTPPPG